MPGLLLEPWRPGAVPLIQPAPPAPIDGQQFPPPTGEQQFVQALSDRTDSLVIERLLYKKGLTMAAITPKLSNLSTAFDAFTQRVEAAAGKLHDRMAGVAEFTETAVGKYSAAVDGVETLAKALDDTANQMTNGGPPLGNSQG